MKTLLLSTIFVVCTLFVMNSTANAQSTSRDYSITNNSGYTITNLYFSPANTNTFGKNVMTSPTIMSNNSFDYTWADYPAETCAWDVMYTTSDGTNYYIEDVDLCTASSFLLTNGNAAIDNTTINTK